jgi:hypothetical protein
LVVAITDTPMFYEAMAETLADQGCVHRLRPGGGDTEIVLRALDPDAVIVDSRRSASEARKSALKRGIPLIHIDSDGAVLRVLTANGWREHSLPQKTSEALQSLLLATVLGRFAG